MEIGERVKELRGKLNMTQQTFGDAINLKRNSIALIEAGRPTSDQTIGSICREFVVNEKWLRTGEGDMFVPEIDPIGNVIATYHMIPEMRPVFETLAELPPDGQRWIVRFVNQYIQRVTGIAVDCDESK